ncbi:hypothetical protein U27_04622 [Candidatus Vecturithrix granuli]|uniref:Uncharacterized protein n=1 Tax=Vecturithrix granuli TaxID=1499967 RepID=A0A081BZA0_VECG1|nr:hypothetical protein U27_04622 [Candidatus Vecturithrix granuli]
MMKILKGIVKFRDLGMGAWEFETPDGEKYELIGGDDDLYRDGQKAEIKGRRRDDLMSAGNMGPIFEVHSAKIEIS